MTRALAAFDDAIAFFHAQLDQPVEFPQDGVDTPREYFREVRGWADETDDVGGYGAVSAVKAGETDV